MCFTLNDSNTDKQLVELGGERSEETAKRDDQTSNYSGQTGRLPLKREKSRMKIWGFGTFKGSLQKKKPKKF